VALAQLTEKDHSRAQGHCAARFMRIQTFTTRYDPGHDRLALDVCDARGVTARLWLTRRLLARLAPHLLVAVQKQIRLDADVQARSLETANVYAQLHARVARRHAPAVAWLPGQPEAVIAEVQVHSLADGACALELSCADGSTYQLQMTAREQRQWLDAARRLCAQAEWALEIWPSWMFPGETPVGASRS